MPFELILFVLIAVALFLVFGKKAGAQGGDRKRKQSDEEVKEASTGFTDDKFYTKQNVEFLDKDGGYENIMKGELDNDNPHFNTLRQHATSSVKGKDFLGVHFNKNIWLFPVSQKYLKELYAMTNLNGKMASIPFAQAVGYAPKGMPFTETTEDWKELRKNLAAIFHSDFMDTYMQNFHSSVKELVSHWKEESGKTRNIKHDICDMAFNSAMLCLTGDKLDAKVPYNDTDKTNEIHIKDANSKTLNEFAKHAASKEFSEDKQYRFKSNSMKCNKLNENMGTIEGALTGLVKDRAAEITNGAPTGRTIVDAAFGLLTKGVIKDVEEAVHHGWAILNGAHNNCGNALSAAIYYLLKNPECLEKLQKELESELFVEENIDENQIEELVTRETLKDLEYLNSVVKETLRLSSPIYGKPMRAKEDVKLTGGFEVKKGTVIYPNNGVIGVSENIWKEPTKFIPERFDPESPYFKDADGGKREPITWLAFGSGPRACMGDNFSMYFVKVGLAYFLHLFKFELKDSNVEGFFYWLNDKTYTAKVTLK